MPANQGRGASLRRVLSLMLRLKGKRYAPSLQELADEFGVSKRTVRRDLLLLEDVGVQLPIWRFNEVLVGRDAEAVQTLDRISDRIRF